MNIGEWSYKRARFWPDHPSPCFAAVVEEARNCGGPVEFCLPHAGEALAAAAGFDDPADPRTAAEPEVSWAVTLADPLLIMALPAI